MRALRVEEESNPTREFSGFVGSYNVPMSKTQWHAQMGLLGSTLSAREWALCLGADKAQVARYRRQ
jgi:hypothetical protein